jgi:cell division septation protein DedD
MTRTDGEHELVLGNKQLLSAFFVVVVLLGVFFTMGYFVGKNTATAGFNSGTTAGANGTRADGTSKPLDSGSSTASSAAPDSTSAASDPNASATPAPVPDTSSSSPVVPSPVEAKAEPKPAPQKEKKPVVEETSGSETSDTMAQPSSEQKYLQVSAVRRPDADNMVKVLRERGFPARLGESSKPELFRVLVGPFKTTGELGRTKADLKAKGFESIVAK